MSRAARFRQADLERAIRAAQKAGLSIAGIAPDGTIVVGKPMDKPMAGANDAPGLKSPEQALAELRELAK